MGSNQHHLLGLFPGPDLESTLKRNAVRMLLDAPSHSLASTAFGAQLGQTVPPDAWQSLPTPRLYHVIKGIPFIKARKQPGQKHAVVTLELPPPQAAASAPASQNGGPPQQQPLKQMIAPPDKNATAFVMQLMAMSVYKYGLSEEEDHAEHLRCQAACLLALCPGHKCDLKLMASWLKRSGGRTQVAWQAYKPRMLLAAKKVQKLVEDDGYQALQLVPPGHAQPPAYIPEGHSGQQQVALCMEALQRAAHAAVAQLNAQVPQALSALLSPRASFRSASNSASSTGSKGTQQARLLTCEMEVDEGAAAAGFKPLKLRLLPQDSVHQTSTAAAAAAAAAAPFSTHASPASLASLVPITAPAAAAVPASARTAPAAAAGPAAAAVGAGGGGGAGGSVDAQPDLRVCIREVYDGRRGERSSLTSGPPGRRVGTQALQALKGYVAMQLLLIKDGPLGPHSISSPNLGLLIGKAPQSIIDIYESLPKPKMRSLLLQSVPSGPGGNGPTYVDDGVLRVQEHKTNIVVTLDLDALQDAWRAQRSAAPPHDTTANTAPTPTGNSTPATQPTGNPARTLPTQAPVARGAAKAMAAVLKPAGPTSAHQTPAHQHTTGAGAPQEPQAPGGMFTPVTVSAKAKTRELAEAVKAVYAHDVLRRSLALTLCFRPGHFVPGSEAGALLQKDPEARPLYDALEVPKLRRLLEVRRPFNCATSKVLNQPTPPNGIAPAKVGFVKGGGKFVAMPDDGVLRLVPYHDNVGVKLDVEALLEASKFLQQGRGAPQHTAPPSPSKPPHAPHTPTHTPTPAPLTSSTPPPHPPPTHTAPPPNPPPAAPHTGANRTPFTPPATPPREPIAQVVNPTHPLKPPPPPPEPQPSPSTPQTTTTTTTTDDLVDECDPLELARCFACLAVWAPPCDDTVLDEQTGVALAALGIALLCQPPYHAASNGGPHRFQMRHAARLISRALAVAQGLKIGSLLEGPQAVAAAAAAVVQVLKKSSRHILILDKCSGRPVEPESRKQSLFFDTGVCVELQVHTLAADVRASTMPHSKHKSTPTQPLHCTWPPLLHGYSCQRVATILHQVLASNTTPLKRCFMALLEDARAAHALTPPHAQLCERSRWLLCGNAEAAVAAAPAAASNGMAHSGQHAPTHASVGRGGGHEQVGGGAVIGARASGWDGQQHAQQLQQQRQQLREVQAQQQARLQQAQAQEQQVLLQQVQRAHEEEQRQGDLDWGALGEGTAALGSALQHEASAAEPAAAVLGGAGAGRAQEELGVGVGVGAPSFREFDWDVIDGEASAGLSRARAAEGTQPHAHSSSLQQVQQVQQQVQEVPAPQGVFLPEPIPMPPLPDCWMDQQEQQQQQFQHQSQQQQYPQEGWWGGEAVSAGRSLSGMAGGAGEGEEGDLLSLLMGSD